MPRKQDKNAQHAQEKAGHAKCLHVFDDFYPFAQTVDLVCQNMLRMLFVLGMQGPDAPANGVETVGVGHQEQGDSWEKQGRGG